MGWGELRGVAGAGGDSPAGRIPMCCWPSSTKLPIGWPSGLYAAPWLTEGSRRKPDCSHNVDMKKGGGEEEEEEGGGEEEEKTHQTISNCPSLSPNTL